MKKRKLNTKYVARIMQLFCLNLCSCPACAVICQKLQRMQQFIEHRRDMQIACAVPAQDRIQCQQ